MPKKVIAPAIPLYLNADNQIRMSDDSLITISQDEMVDGSYELFAKELFVQDAMDDDKPAQLYDALDSGRGWLRLPNKPDSKLDFWGFLKIGGIYYNIFVYSGRWQLRRYNDELIPAEAQAIR